MECRINEVAVHYVERGSGVPLVALHGAGVDHREIETAIEAIVPSAGLPADLPGSAGDGPHGTDGLTGNDDVVTLLGDFLDHLGAGPVMLLGHSYGAYLARGVVARSTNSPTASELTQRGCSSELVPRPVDQRTRGPRRSDG